MDHNEGVVVAVVGDETEAEIVRGLLDSAGIASASRPTEAIDSPLEDFSSALSPQEILVGESDVEAARELLKQPEA